MFLFGVMFPSSVAGLVAISEEYEIDVPSGSIEPFGLASFSISYARHQDTFPCSIPKDRSSQTTVCLPFLAIPLVRQRRPTLSFKR